MAFDPSQPFSIIPEAELTGFDPSKPFKILSEKDLEPVGTSIGQEISQLPAALKQSFGQPLEAIGETAQVSGFPAVGAALKGAIQEPEGYVSAGQRFMEPQEGEFQIAGFAPQYAPRAIAEQTGQILGSIGTRLAGAVAGGGLGALISPGAGVAGAAAGSFAGPALFEAAQIVGPVALERAKNNGYTEPTDEDMAYAVATAAGSGLLNAFGAKYLPGGEKAIGSFSKRLAASFLGEGIPEGLQSLVQQVGETVETKKGIQVSPKQAIGEALIGGGAGAAATIASAPFTPEQIEEQKITESANKEAENLFIGNDNPQGKAVLANKQKLEQEVADAKQVLSVIESTDPVARKLKLELKEKEAILAAAQGQVDSIVDSNEPVVEAEKQQIALAKEIAAPEVVAPAPTEVTPTEITVAEAATPVVEGLQAISENTATPEQLTELSQSGLIDIIKGEPVINEEGQAVLTQAEAPLPKLTPEERRAEIEAAPVAETPAVAPAPEVAPAEIEAVHFSRTPMKLEKGVDISKIKGAYEEESTFGRGFYAAEKADESMWREMDRFKLGDFRNEVKISPQNPLIISPETVKKLGYDSIKDRIDKGNYDAIITRGWSEDTGNKISQRIEQLWTPKFPSGKTSGRFTNVEEFRSANEQAIKEITGLSEYDYTNLDKQGWNQNQIFIPPDTAPDIVSTTPAVSETITPAPPVAEAPAITPAPVAETPAVAPAAEVAPAPAKLTLWRAERNVGDIKEGPSLGTFLTNSEQAANSLADLKGNVERIDVEINKPLTIPSGPENAELYFSSEDVNKLLADAGVKYKVWSGYPMDEFWRILDAEGKKMLNAIKKAGYDSIQYPEFLGGQNQTTTLLLQHEKEGQTFKSKITPTPTPAVSETITPAEPEGKAEAIKFADEALRERDKEVGRYKKKVDVERKAGREEMAQRYEGIIDDLMSVPANEFKQDVIENPAYYIESNVDPFLRFKNKEVNRAAPLTPSKRKREAGGVLIPSREDLIQAGQNIYEAGMEFGAWAKQMIQQFGDVVREFLGDVWQAVSGMPAKLNEVMGYLPKKGEAGAVNIGRGEKQPTKKPTPEQPTPTPEKPTEPVTEVPSGERQQIMGEKIGPLKKTPEGIIAETQAKLRERFDPTKVTEQNTTEAFRALGRLTGKDGTAFAQELNDIGRMVDESGAAAEVSMGAALFVNDLFEYAVRLAAQGDKKMLGIMMTNINKLPTGTEGRSDAGRALRAAREMKDTFLTMAKAEQDAFINYAAEFVYGPNPTKQQVDSIKIGYDAVEKVQEPTAKEVEEEIAAVGEKTGTDLVGRINDEFTKATEKGQAKRKTEIEELDSEYKKIQEQADKEIEKLAKIQSDTPSFDPTAARQTANDVRAIVANDLKQRPDMGRKAPWKSMLVAKLQEAGVEVAAAETLADIVWRQHEINNLSRELSSINKAVEKGPISEIIKAIKETPLEQQQNPNWRYEVMRDYLRKAGLSVAQAERIAKLMDISLQKRFTQAKEQAFTDAISKTAPWKAGDVRSKRAFQQVIQAIRAGALDPSRNMASDIAAMNGWTGFTADQYKNLLKNDAILANEDSKDIQKAEAYKAIQDIISKSKLPIRARDVIGQYYDAQALSGIPTLTVNSFSPIAFAMRNAIVQAGSGTIKGDAKAIGRAATAFVDSIKSWANTVAFSFKNNVTVYSNVDYIVNDDNLLRLYRKGVDQFTKSKNAKERADGVKNMMIGMMDYVRRILNALDYGAIASLQNQNISKYAMAVMKNKGMNNKQANEVFAAMMKEKNDFYLNQIAIGTDKNKARILADEFYISSWKKSLEKEGVTEEKIKSAMDAAINDALSSVGRNRQSLDAFKEEATNIKDAGLASSPALWLLESVANAANRSDSQFIKIFSRVIYGFAIVPARVIRETAWFSPYGFVRLAVDAALKKRNIESRYAQSLGSDFQRQQRLNEAIAGTVALFGLMALRSGSTDDPEDEDEFKIVFTGNGPQRKDDPQFYDSWYKAGNKPNSMIVSFGKTKFTLNMMRGFEAFTWPAMMLGAIDDLEIRKKQKQQTKTPAQLEDAAIVAGFVFDAALRRGPYAFTTKSLFGAYGDIGVEGVAKGLTFPAKTLIPVLGTSLASNLSNFLNDPIDRRTLDGAVWSNIPFIGPAVAPKSLNAFGEPSLSTDLASKMFKLGVPIVYDIPTDRESIKLHELVLKQGGGPSIPTRNQLAQRLDRQPTNKEYEMFVREYGALIKEDMKLNFEELSEATPELYSKYVDRIGLVARDIAETRVREKFEKP